MRPGQQNKRGRGRNNNNNNNNNGGGGNNNHNRKGQNPLTRTYDSSGPDVKIRGTAQHIAEKYTTLARDAQSSGDRVIAENYLQHAEHYNRIIAAAQAQMQERFQRDDRSSYDGNDMDGNDRDGMMDDDQDQGYDDQPAMIQQPTPRREQPRQQQPQQQRTERADRQEQRSDRTDRPVQVERQERSERAEQAERPERAERTERAPRPERQPRGERPVAAQHPVAAAPETVIDGTGPQPEIEGTPAEVVIEEEASAGRAPRRRAAPRPRRPRRTEGSAEEGVAGEQPEAPVLADSE
ncbi:DUF4167 domain-containing protein [Rhizobium sp. Leaf341]|uniref:DUF4167 domain-containing protein n=1 Tax=Rhizobium sp. Leaf341 TaxID=1736344 RepID=UPI000715B420|nr:DUF4167 domain-containing protein [Rhizobium sp. Leaf341]KQR75628.1 hypothetical protein ASG03_18230 [Rhizobium sp. Leaf341]